MNRRARRIALLTVVAGCLVVGGLAAFNWPTLRDHAEAWWFIWTRKTVTVHPEAKLKKQNSPSIRDPYFGLLSLANLPWDWAFRCLASDSDRPVVLDAERQLNSSCPFDWNPPSVEIGLAWLRKRGFQILEQRFPDHVYVVTGYPASDFESPQPLRGAPITLEPEVISR